MNQLELGLRNRLSWPASAAIVFLLIPVSLSYLYPTSFWANTDYQPLGLADALNFAYRLADLKMYTGRGMADHPGVPFYFMNWFALALTGFPIAWKDARFYTEVLEHLQTYYSITIWLGASIGAFGVYLFARVAQRIAPTSTVMLGLLMWLVSTPATLLMFTSPSIDSFAILINALFFAVLVKLAYRPDITANVCALGAAASAFGYLNKLSYVYIGLSLAGTQILNLILRRPGWLRSIWICVIFVALLLAIVFIVGKFVIGQAAFDALIEFHKQVILGSGMYGSGKESVVSGDAIRLAIAAIPAEGTYALAIALVGGFMLGAAGLVTALRGPEHLPAAIIAVGSGFASCFSALIVLKHYSLHYTAGVSATLPASVVALYLLTKDWKYQVRWTAALLGIGAIAAMGARNAPALATSLALVAKRTELASADRKDFTAHLGRDNRLVEFVYAAPFAEYGEGFVVVYGSVPRLTQAYRDSRRDVISSMTADLTDREVGVFVLDKIYFPTAEAIKSSPNIALVSPRPATMKEGDKLIELRTVFLLIRQ
ncbi:hypothetical protein CI1B_59130 [Bradyrhizobium ivorense]|uniref:Glycosyltransferase RgtA/B/C/D-like domain-containing protein n=1 Tax=Bradyrhizobium ivorense TaxID=2511166 RepID=A0A508TLY3_9BRAD|nr:hypothetical protein [Bradyrhizobium ivorense]VIO75407.1 hypothetical protein CI1B_59130 [Bradyrhizobium ivorense]